MESKQSHHLCCSVKTTSARRPEDKQPGLLTALLIVCAAQQAQLCRYPDWMLTAAQARHPCEVGTLSICLHGSRQSSHHQLSSTDTLRTSPFQGRLPFQSSWVESRNAG